MPFATNPFTLDPVRTGELKTPQIKKEIQSLETSIQGLEETMKRMKQVPKNPRAMPKKKETGLPSRFRNPETWKYECKQEHASYSTTTHTYGRTPPTRFDMPTQFHAQTSHFTAQLDRAGPYRNFSLNI
jgi:hypothetical protein